MNPRPNFVPAHDAPGWPSNPSSGQGDSSLTSTLIVKHLPEAVPQETLSRLFSHYGASGVRPCSGGRLRNSVFVDFKNDALAYQAQRQLNGLRFLGKVLKVERASNFTKDNEATGDPLPKDISFFSSPKEVLLSHDRNESLNARSFPAAEPIAPKLGVDYPFPPHLEYAYPPPDGNILTNIVNSLIAVPRFYTQVLHLMNKMNIPAPFRMALPTPPMPSSARPPPPPLSAETKSSPAAMSNSESELESSEEEASIDVSSLKGKSRRKRPRREAILGPAADKDVAHESVGVKPSALVPKEIPVIKKKNPVLQIKIAPKVPKTRPADEHVMNDPEEPEDTSDVKPFASPDELKKGRLPPEEILSLPMFKNYTAGNPAPVLYIKNLSKDVTVEDFYYIFGSLFGNVDEAKSNMNVKLMQEGRMRGQAFVTFPSVEFAHQALNLVNGYVFKDKPMIIQFGRNPSATKAN